MNTTTAGLDRSFRGAAGGASGATVFPLWLRVTHWLNAIAVIVMIGSGWRIYNASPLYGFAFPPSITLGGWLAGALSWHFAAMWIVVVNGLAYLVANLVTRRFFRQFFPLSWRGFRSDAIDAFRGRLSHDDLRTYNAVQRAAYVFVMVALAMLVLSGLVLWKNVQFPLLRELLGGYEVARHVHFVSMVAVGLFLVVHVVMTLLVPRTLVAMVRGR